MSAESVNSEGSVDRSQECNANAGETGAADMPMDRMTSCIRQKKVVKVVKRKVARKARGAEEVTTDILDRSGSGTSLEELREAGSPDRTNMGAPVAASTP